MEQKMTFNLLTVRGKVKPGSVEETRQLHNQTAGDPGGVAAAKSLGDMSHLVFMPLNAATDFNGDLLFMDIWNNLQGLQQFFSDAQVQAGAEMMFASREAIVWRKIDGFLNFQFPAPTGVNGRIVGLLHGKVNSLEEAENIHNSVMEKHVNTARAAGILSHEFYVREAAPGSPESLEILGMDTWMHVAGMISHYSNPAFQNSGLYNMFSAPPSTSTWVHPTGEWVEW